MIAEFIRIVFGLGMFINAALFVPQAIRIVRTKSAEGLSLITFGGFCLIQLSAIAYGYIEHDYYLSLGYALSFVSCGCVTLLILFYRRK